MTVLRAGVARRTISPPPGIFLMGYGNREQGNLGIHDELYATTLVFDDGTTRAALITADHTFINAKVVAQIKEQLATSGFSEDAVFVCCSHTHAGPIGYADEDSRPEDRDYIADLIDRLTGSALDALRCAQPATLSAGADEAEININRRERSADGSIVIGNNPLGLVDHSVQVVQVRDPFDHPLATLVNYACHPVVMGPLNRLASADWVGGMRRTVEAAIPGPVLFVQGATADVNPRKMRWTVDSWDEVEAQGRPVGEAVLRAVGKMMPLETGAIRARQVTHWLELLPPQGYKDAIRAFLPNATSDDEIRAAIQAEFPWHTEIEERGGGLYTALSAGALRVGEWALAALETEPFTETGLLIKAASPVRMTFVAGYTNGCNAYLPVASAYESGGYEVETAALFYGLPAGFAPGGAETVTESIIEMLKTL